MDDLDRLFHRLVHNLRAKNPAHLALPFTVAELYEQLVPYRHNRRELAIETNQDYEIAVTRLLSGERGYLLADAAMQEALQKELAAAAPDTGAFREYATAEVSIAPAALAKVGAAPPAAQAGRAQGGPQAAPAHQSAAAQQAAVESPARMAESPGAAPRAEPSPHGSDSQARREATAPGPESALPFDQFSVPEGCRFCGATLPEGRNVKFCPSCGQDLTLSRCPACGSEIEEGWRFCVTCGRPAG